MSFDLQLSHSIFQANLNSFLKISQENVTLINNQNQDYLSRLIGQNPITGNQNSNNFSEFTHLSNIDWILLNSIYTGIQSHFERHMFALASIVEDRSKSEIKLNDLAGKGIIKYLNYLRLVGHIQSIKPSKEPWQEVLLHQKVRNIIVHNGGLMLNDISLKLENHECFNFLEKNKVIMAGRLGHIRIRELEIIELIVKTLTDVSDRLTNEIQAKYP